MSLTNEQKEKISNRFLMATPLLVSHWVCLGLILYSICGVIVCWDSIKEMSKSISYYYFFGSIFLDPLIILISFFMSGILISSGLVRHYFFKKFAKHIDIEKIVVNDENKDENKPLL